MALHLSLALCADLREVGVQRNQSRFAPGSAGRMAQRKKKLAILIQTVPNAVSLPRGPLCQRCHLHYDRDHHARNGAETRRKKKWAVGLIARLNLSYN
jgi:hypothetical protein